MKVHKLTPNTPEWLAYRDTMFNASDAPAMMGCSVYKTRNQLLHERATGQPPVVDAGTQRRFNEGHRIENLARPLAEKIIGQELYPQVGSEGEYSASFDGLSMDESENFEHKTLNDELRAAFADIETIAPEYREAMAGGHLPLQYQVQMEQQHMVSGCTRTLFMASKWDGETLVEERHCWYYPNFKLRQKIIAGWAQFAADLAVYVPPEVIVPAVAAPQIGLPAVSITVNGSIALVDNLDKFGAALTAYIDKLNRKPETDQDFANLEDAVKRLKAAEEQLDAAEAGALGQTESIDTMRRTVALHRETARTTRLLIDKLVKAEKENRRTKIVSDAVAELVTHIRNLNNRLGAGYMPSIAADFQGVVKGLKSLDSMKDKVAGELARCKIESNAMADRIQANLETKGLHGYAFLFADLAAICTKAPEDFQNTVTARITAHEAAQAAKEAAMVARIEAEAKAKAEREAREKIAAEQAAADTLAREQAAFEKLERDETARLAKLNTTMVVEAAPVAPVSTVVPMPVRAPSPTVQASPPTLRLGQINDRLSPIQINADGLRALGFEPAATDRASKLYHEASFTHMCAALVQHINGIQATQAA